MPTSAHKAAAAAPATAAPATVAATAAAPVPTPPVSAIPSLVGTMPVPPHASPWASCCLPTAPTLVSRTLRCPDCGEQFASREAQLLHQLNSGAPHAAAPPTTSAAASAVAAAAAAAAAPPTPSAPAAADGGIAAAITAAITAAVASATAAAAGGSGAAGGVAAAPTDGFAPKHGVRVLRSALDVAMVVPMLHAEAAVALDLEGELTPGAAQGIDLMQLYLPSIDLVLLIHSATIGAADVSRLLGPWLTSAAHVKVLCDCRADAEALRDCLGVRLQGVCDVQVLHAVLNRQLKQLPVAAVGASAVPAFFFPTGLHRLAAQCGGEAIGEHIAQLKTHFSRVFDESSGASGAEGRPFGSLPLSAEAATYAASDAWHTWLVYETLWPKAAADGLGAVVVAISERRACDFRDCPGGREKWEAAMAQAKERRLESRERRSGPRDAKDGKGARAEGGAEKRQKRSVAAPSPADKGDKGDTGDKGDKGDKKLSKRDQRKLEKKLTKGPPPGKVMCEACNVQMDDVPSQLRAHRAGKRHQLASSIVARKAACPLLLEWRPETSSKEVNPLSAHELRGAIEKFGALRKMDMAPSRLANGRWSATVEFCETASAAHVVAQKLLVVGDKAVTSGPVDALQADEQPNKKQRVQ